MIIKINGQDAKCPITLDPIELENAAVTGCGHFFDKKAIEKWKKKCGENAKCCHCQHELVYMPLNKKSVNELLHYAVKNKLQYAAKLFLGLKQSPDEEPVLSGELKSLKADPSYISEDGYTILYFSLINGEDWEWLTSRLLLDPRSDVIYLQHTILLLCKYDKDNINFPHIKRIFDENSHREINLNKTHFMDSGDVALHCAARYGNVELWKLLVSSGADPNKKNKKAVTPMELLNEHYKEGSNHQAEKERLQVFVQLYTARISHDKKSCLVIHSYWEKNVGDISDRTWQEVCDHAKGKNRHHLFFDTGQRTKETIKKMPPNVKFILPEDASIVVSERERLRIRR